MSPTDCRCSPSDTGALGQMTSLCGKKTTNDGVDVKEVFQGTRTRLLSGGALSLQVVLKCDKISVE